MSIHILHNFGKVTDVVADDNDLPDHGRHNQEYRSGSCDFRHPSARDISLHRVLHSTTVHASVVGLTSNVYSKGLT